MTAVVRRLRKLDTELKNYKLCLSNEENPNQSGSNEDDMIKLANQKNLERFKKEFKLHAVYDEVKLLEKFKSNGKKKSKKPEFSLNLSVGNKGKKRKQTDEYKVLVD